MPTRNVSTLAAGLLLAAAIAGLVLAIYDYYTPLTGVNGTPGALLVIGVSALIAVLTVLVVIPEKVRRPWLRIAWRVLIFILLGGCCFAGALLHEWWLCIAMIVGAFAVCVNAIAPYAAPTQPHHGAAQA